MCVDAKTLLAKALPERSLKAKRVQQFGELELATGR
jgi:hypothetical protein